MRSIIIFGNGLGMAIDPSYYNLATALSAVWNNTNTLSAQHKSLIQSAIPGTSNLAPPSSESQLDQIHGAISAAKYLQGFGTQNISWLTDHAQQIPEIFRKFIHEVALYFHRSPYKLPENFVANLSQFIHATKSHIATLNYDNLLYDSLLQSQVLKGFSGSLIDGFTNTDGFTNNNLIRFGAKGWYMHLHGSPLFVGNGKVSGAARAFQGPDCNNHIVLTHVQHKPYYISESPILSRYWELLEEAIDESDRVFLFGYSGDDTHLNKIIQVRPQKHVFIIEWSGTVLQGNRFLFWNSKLKHTNYRLFSLLNILDFNDWYGQLPVNTADLQQIQ